MSLEDRAKLTATLLKRLEKPLADIGLVSRRHRALEYLRLKSYRAPRALEPATVVRRVKDTVDTAVADLGLEDTVLREALSYSLLQTSLKPSERIGLAILATAVQNLEIALVTDGVLVRKDEFVKQAGVLAVPSYAAEMVYDLLRERMNKLIQQRQPASRVLTYLALHESNLTNRLNIIKTSTASLAQTLNITTNEATRLRHHAFREHSAKSGYELVTIVDKGARRTCCPPFSDPRWEDRYDYFGEGSRLAELVKALKENIQGRIRQMFASFITIQVRQAAADFGVGNAALYNTSAPDAPFFSSGEQIQSMEDLWTKSTRQEAETWILNIRKQLEQVWNSLIVVALDSWIFTSDDDSYGGGGGDGDSVHLYILGTSGVLMDVAPDVDGLFYDDGNCAFQAWGSKYPFWQTPMPTVIRALEVTGFQLQYLSDNDWLFEQAAIFFRYEVNGHSRLLTDEQPADDQNTAQDDRVHNDQEEGWVTNGYSGDWGVRSDSRLFRAQCEFYQLQNTLTAIQNALNSPDLDNIFVTRGDEIIAAFEEAATQTRRGEYVLARSQYFKVLEILTALTPDDLTELSSELLFAIHVLIATSYVASASLSPGYAHFVEAFVYLDPEDTQSADYLWLRLAELFIRWGDQIYAAAGGDYKARLLALDRYRKITAPTMQLTYDDGAEDEILDLWIDLARVDASVPADPGRWVRTFTARCVKFFSASLGGASAASSLGLLPTFDQAAVVDDWEVIHPETAKLSQKKFSGRFLRVRLDVSETRLSRADLNLIIANERGALNAWSPTDVRVQIRLATYNPSAERSTRQFRGRNADIRVFSQPLGDPRFSGTRGWWTVELAADAVVGANKLIAPRGCARQLFRKRAQLRIDQIRAHLNFFGIHDEYVPNGRFQSLVRLASGIADRAAYYYDRYLEFLGKAEAANLEELDAAFMRQLGDANLNLARERLAGAALDLEADTAAARAASESLGLSQRTLNVFQQTNQIGLQRFLNNVSVSLPPAVSLNLGGVFGTLTGGDGYDAQMRTQELERENAVVRDQAALEAAEFRRRLSEIEKLIAEENVSIEEMRNANLQERLNFLSNRILNATFWYETARLYREMAETKIEIAARWAWISERALEFEINIPVSQIRMDYYLIPLGANRLQDDLEQLQIILSEFRERYRDVPNIIEREFRFSVDFPAQFRALTSSDTSPPAIALGQGVRAIEFRTPMHAYDVRLPGRYAFGRVLGVELELQTDVAASVFSGHVENSRVIHILDATGRISDIQCSESLVRVPIPTKRDDTVLCPPVFDLDNSSVEAPSPQLPDDTGKWPPKQPIDPEVMIEVVRKWLDLAWPVLPNSQPDDPLLSIAPPVFGDPSSRLVAKRPIDRRRQRLSRLSTPVQQVRRMARDLLPLVSLMWEPYGLRAATFDVQSYEPPTQAMDLILLAQAAGVTREELQYLSNSLVSSNFDPDPDKVYRRRIEQLKKLSQKLAGTGFELSPSDLEALLALRSKAELISSKAYEQMINLNLARPGRLTYQRYEMLLEQTPPRVIFRDVTPNHGSARTRVLDTLPDYIHYSSSEQAYGLRLKRHDAESLTLSTFSRREDLAVFNPYNAGDQLGVFENTGIESDWRLTLRALPSNPLNPQPQWDKIRDVIFRVWYHAAYERHEGFRLAQIVEPQVIRYASRKVLSVSFYRDFYDEFRTILGDYDQDDPTSLAAVRSFSDQSHAASGGWIEFVIDEGLVPAVGQRISAALLAFTSSEPSVFPNYHWQLRYGASSPSVDGTAVGDAGTIASLMSAAQPNGFAGLDPRGSWFFRLAAADNPGLGLGAIEDIELIFEFEPL